MNRRKDVAGNRAVSALFRVFGGTGPREIADGFERTEFRAMHRGERLLLGWIVPLTVFAGLSEWLVKWFGPLPGWLALPPLGFLFLNLLAFSMPGRQVAVQWRCWLLLLAVWGAWRIDAGGYVSIFAGLWLGIFAVNAIAFGLLGIGGLMRVNGRGATVLRGASLLGLHLAAIATGWHWGWPWALVGGASIAAVYCAAVLNPSCQWLGPVLRFKEGKEILITIDDGPDPHDTPRLLDLLDRHGKKAIFFMIGEKVRRHPELVREVLRRGHEIGNHTMTHPQASFWCAGPWRTRREIADCQRAIHEATGGSPRWFRAPVGHRNLFTHPIADELGMKVMGWSRRGFDAVEKDPKVVLDRILPLTGGDIVLMHEGTGIAEEVLEGILAAC